MQTATTTTVAKKAADLRRQRLYPACLAAIFFMTMWPRYGFFKIFFLPKFSPFTLATLVALGMIALVWLQDRWFKRWLADLWKNNRLLISLFLAWWTFRYVADTLGDGPLPSYYLTLRETVYGASFFLIAAIVTSTQNGRDEFVEILVIGAFIAIGIAIFEMVMQVSAASYVCGYFGGIEEAELNRVCNVAARNGSLRVLSIFDHPIVLGQFAAAMLPIMLHAVKRLKSIWYRRLALMTIVAAPIAAYGSGSRAALPAMAVGFVVYWIGTKLGGLRRGRLIEIGVGVAAVSAFVVTAKEFIVRHIIGSSTIEISSTNTRLFMWVKGIPWIKRSPFIGYGDGNAIKYAGFRNGQVATLDDYSLMTILNYGFIGFAIFVCYILTFMYSGLSVAVNAVKAMDRDLAAACVASSVALMMVQEIICITNNLTLLYLATGCIASLRANERSNKTSGVVKAP
jgi:hypothetical protein